VVNKVRSSGHLLTTAILVPKVLQCPSRVEVIRRDSSGPGSDIILVVRPSLRSDLGPDRDPSGPEKRNFPINIVSRDNQ
jgi:hypothetical protein